MAEVVALSEDTTVLGDNRDLELLAGTSGILNMLSSSFDDGVGVLFMRASIRASGL